MSSTPPQREEIHKTIQVEIHIEEVEITGDPELRDGWYIEQTYKFEGMVNRTLYGPLSASGRHNSRYSAVHRAEHEIQMIESLIKQMMERK